MGHKAIVVFDMDHLDTLTRDPQAFVERLKQELLSHKRTGGAVRHSGATAAQVVWSGHVNETPALEFPDFHAQPVSLETAKTIAHNHQRQAALDSLNP